MEGLTLLSSFAELLSPETVNLSVYLESKELDETTETDEETPTVHIHEEAPQLPVKRGRGRPKGSKNKIKSPETILQKRKRSSEEKHAEQVPEDGEQPLKKRRGRPPKNKKPEEKNKEEEEQDSEIHRKRRLYPTSLLDLEQVPILKITDQNKIALSEKKLQEVMNGTRLFGQKIIIPSFEAALPPYEMHATLCNLFFFNVLFSSNVLETSTGKVSIFPVTIYKDEKQVSGFPCILIHSSHMKTLMWSIFSGCRQLFKNNTFEDNLPNILCSYSVQDDQNFHQFTGCDPYTCAKSKCKPAYLLIPAHWMDVMKHFFLDPKTSKPYDIGHLCRVTYQNRPDMEGKFDDEYRCIWLGEERISNVSYIISTPDSHNVFSMTRCRAVDNQVSRAGTPWKLRQGKAPIKMPNYDNLSFAYGVQCWKEQLQLLNTAVVFFSGYSQTRPMHQVGLFTYDEDTRVKSRKQCLVSGILDDSETNVLLTNDLRRQRAALKSQFGEDFVINYFGNVGVYLKTTCV